MAANGKRNVMANRVQTEYVGEARCRVYIIKMGGGDSRIVPRYHDAAIPTENDYGD